MAVPAFATRPADDAERQAAATALADAACRLDALQALEQQVLADRIAGVESPIAPSVGKLLGTELRQHLTELAVSIAGPYAAARLPIGEAGAHALALPEDALWAMGTYLNDRAASIYAGTNEVQRNLIAQHLLSAPPAMEAVLPLDDTQSLLQSSLQRWLQDNAPFERRAALLATPGGFQPLWTGLAQQLGLLGAALPEAVGGQGGSLADHLVVLQALGQALLPEPYSACLVTGAGLLQRLPSPATQALLAGVADGAVRPVLAALEPGARHDLAQVATRLHADGTLSGRKALVRAAPQATHWLVSARDGAGILRLALVRPGAAGATQRDVRLSDGGWAAELAFDHTPCEALPEAPDGSGDMLPLLQQVADEALLATGAEAVGVMQRLLHETLDYVRQRKQFGVAIASFQVTQHRLADMHMALIQARALVAATLAAMDQPPAQRARAVAACQLQVARAARTVGQSAVQLHGGMGMTEELAVGHAFKRLTLIEHHQGGPAVHLQRVVRWQDAQPAPSTPA
jgi:alkylation response protein AidB-like acyl-CoA dehydrogenase